MLNHLIVAMLAILSVCGDAKTSRAASWQPISPHRIHSLILEGSGLWLVDVRNSAAFEQGHIEGALNIPYEQLKIKNLPKGKSVVLVDDSLGLQYARAGAELLLKKGHEKVFVMEGGIAAWEAEKLPVTATVGNTPRPVRWDELVWARSSAVALRLYDLRDAEERAKGPVDGAQQPKGKNPGERLAALRSEISARDTGKGKTGKPEALVPVVLILPTASNFVDQTRTTLRGLKTDVRYLEGAYPLWVSREKEKPLTGPDTCPTCPAGRKK